MIGDRVKIGRTGFIPDNEGDMVFVYAPKIDKDNGQFITTNDGTVIVDSLGGVKAGSTGTIQGHPIKVNRTQMKDWDGVPGLGTNDHVLFFPVFLDYYQKLGWFPVDFVKAI